MFSDKELRKIKKKYNYDISKIDIDVDYFFLSCGKHIHSEYWNPLLDDILETDNRLIENLDIKPEYSKNLKAFFEYYLSRNLKKHLNLEKKNNISIYEEVVFVQSYWFPISMLMFGLDEVDPADGQRISGREECIRFNNDLFYLDKEKQIKE